MKPWVVLFTNLINKMLLKTVKASVTVLAFMILYFSSFSQTEIITYHSKVSGIITKHCTTCHFENGYSPFSLETYSDVSKRADFILHVLENKIMPPWTADTNYRSYINQNVMSTEEIRVIKDWVNLGKPEGTEAKIEVKKTRVSSGFDTTWSFGMERKYDDVEINKDIFKRFYIKTTINRDIYASRFEFKPGNNRIVHHSEVFIDTTNPTLPDFSIQGSDIIEGQKYEERNQDLSNFNYMTGWLPGEMYEEFPDGIYARIPKGSAMYFLIHYAPTPILESDSSSFNIHENIDEGEKRFYSTIDLHGHSDLVGKSFSIPPDSVITLHSIKKVTEKVSAFSLLVHAHHLAKSVLAYIITPESDTLPLIKIPEWNFNWQFIYKFEKFEIIPAGSVVHYYVTYDNTAENPENPNNPPKKIRYSFDADQEMMELFIYAVPYKDGDENTPLNYSTE